LDCFLLRLVTSALLRYCNYDGYREDFQYLHFSPWYPLNTTNPSVRHRYQLTMAREPSVRQIANKLNGAVPNYKQAKFEHSLEESPGQNNAESTGTESLPKASKPTKKRSAPGKKTSTAKPRQRSKRTVAAASASSSGQASASLESPKGQTRKHKTSGADLEGPSSKKVSTRDDDQESVLSELSALSATPEHPGLVGDESFEEHNVVESEEVKVDTTPATSSTLDVTNSLVESAVVASNSPPASTPEHPGIFGGKSLDEQPSIEKDVVGVDAMINVDPKLDTLVESAAAASSSPLSATHEHPGSFGEDFLAAQPTTFQSNDLETNAVATIESAPAAFSSLAESAFDSSFSPLFTNPLIAAVEDAGEQSPSGSVAGSAGPRQIISLKFSPPRLPRLLGISQSAPLPDQPLDPQAVSDPAASLPTPTSAPRRSVRTVGPPARFREPADVSAESIEGESVVEEDDIDPTGDSPTVLEAARKTKPRAKAPVSSEKVTEDDLADDVSAPVATKAPRKREAAAAQSTPRKKPATPKAKADVAKTPKVPKVPKALKTPKTPKARKTPTSKPSVVLAEDDEPMLTLPSPPSSQSDLEADFPIDADLLKLSRAMTHREPLASKPETVVKPEVWAPGRQELCETLPYFKSAHSGCYSNDGTVYGFMFDSTGVGREYMDSNVMIARMGGSMTTDAKTGVMYQTKDHLMKDKQAQSVLNNIAHKNPLVITCGDKNEGAITKMPHRYCVLDWFKPTHVWAEKTMGRKEPRTTIRYRFERLDRSKESWYSPKTAPGGIQGPETPAEPKSSAGLVPAEARSPSTPPSLADLSLPIQTCTACSKSCPQVYLIDWLCTNPDCAAFWKMSNGQDAPYGALDYHPAFLQHRTTWEREDPPFSLNPGVPQVDQHFGDSLAYVSTRGVVCPDCGRCNMRYMFNQWRCDTIGCKWKLTPQVKVVMPSNLGHTPWDMSSDGPSLIKAVVKPAVKTQVGYFSNYKVIKYTIEGVVGSVTVAKANQHIVSEPGGANDMFRELQEVNVGLERRILRKSNQVESLPPPQENAVEPDGNLDADGDEEEAEHQVEAGARMTAFGMNFGMPYKFIATGDSQSFEAAPAAVRAVRSRLNWAQRVFVNDDSGYQDFNELLIFAYLEGQKIKYHDDGEEGLGPRIATLSLGAPATMSLRVKAKYFSQVSKTGVFTDEEPLPLPLLKSCGYASGYTTKAKDAALQASKTPSRDTHVARLAAWNKLQDLRANGDMANFRARSKVLSKELQLKRRDAETLLSFHLTHGDIVIMEGEDIQKFMEHSVEPHGHLRFAMTCRTVLPAHLTPEQFPQYEVLPDSEGYDGAAIKEERDEGREAIVWE
jgi:hypothetical protein